MSYATTPCPKCNEPVISVSVGITRAYLDPVLPVYTREFDFESRQHYWLRDEPIPGEGRQKFARHVCRG